MPETILQTKLFHPRTPPRLVPRPHLVARLNDSMRASQGIFTYKLTLVSAPAGYGKSTLLSEWSQQSPLATAWLSLDAADNNLWRFWSHFIAALATASPCLDVALSEVRQVSTAATIQEKLDGWINQIAASPDPIVLILDDYHLIEEASIHESLAYWLEHCPAQMNLMIATRSDPPLHLSRLRGREQLNELRTSDLRFSAQETAAFLNRAMGLNLSTQNIALLEARTEGWAVGLHMAALSMQGRNSEAISCFIKNFTGSHRYILDYLTDEVLLQQPESIQTFLLHTFHLERLTSGLCDAVTGRRDSQSVLEQLEAANLFVIPLDEEGRWYRYHHLFASMLRQRLESREPDLLPKLNRLASEWCEQNGLFMDALSYALVSGDASRVANLVAHKALVMMEFSELKTLERWLDALPEEAFRSSPWLNLAHAWLLTSIGQLDEVEPLLQRAQAALEGLQHPSEALRQDIAGNLAAVRAYLAGLRGDYLHTIAYARECLTHFPIEDVWMRTWSKVTLAYALLQCGQTEEADQRLAEALELSRETGASHVRLLALSNYAGIQLDKGDLPQAAEIFHQAIQLDQEYASRTGQNLPIAGYAYANLAAIHCEWHDLETAITYIDQGVKISERWGEPQLLTGSYLSLAEIRLALGEPAGALDALSKAKQAAGELPIRATARIAPLQALTQLRAGDLASARGWAASKDAQSSLKGTQSESGFTGYVLARLEFVEGKLEAALDRLADLVQEAQTSGKRGSEIRLLALQAVILHNMKRTAPALCALERALALAEPGGYVQTFIELEAPMAELLVQAVALDISTRYAQRLLQVFEQNKRLYGDKTGGITRHPEELLSERELQVLRLLDTHLSRSEIARQLFISENTLRTHLKHIYRKLGVHSRGEALRRAGEIGL